MGIWHGASSHMPGQTRVSIQDMIWEGDGLIGPDSSLFGVVYRTVFPVRSVYGASCRRLALGRIDIASAMWFDCVIVSEVCITEIDGARWLFATLRTRTVL